MNKDADAQAMALVKKFRLDILHVDNGVLVSSKNASAIHPDLNRAIMECVKMSDAISKSNTK